MQLVICWFWRFHRRRHPVVSTRCFTGMVRVGVKIPQDGNRANVCTGTLLFQLVVQLELVRVGVKIPQDGNRADRYGHVTVVH